MAKVAGPVVGVSITEDRIYAVAVRPGASGTAQVTHVGSMPLPGGVLFGDTVRQAPELAAALRTLLANQGITARDAVIGLPSRAVITRTITIPPVPGKERRSIVRGEIDHLNVLPPGQGAFDFAPLARVPATQTRGESVLFFAAERAVVEAYRSVGKRAGLRVVGMEPSDFAAIRVAYPSLAEKPIALAVSLGSYHTNLVFFQNGQIAYSRRLDIGIHQMITPDPSLESIEEIGHAKPHDEWQEKLTERVNRSAERVVTEVFGDKLGATGAVREVLALEVARSLQYYRRTYQSEVDDVYTVLLPNNLDLAGLPMYMTAALEQEVHLVDTLEQVQASDNLPQSFLQNDSVAYTPALGLALGSLRGRFASAPGFDLSVEDAEVVRARQAPRQFAGALAASAALLLVSATTAAFLARAHAPVKGALQTAHRELQVLTQQEQTLLAERQQQQDLVRQIRAQNVPWTNVLYHLSQIIPPRVGITNITTQGNTLVLTAETKDPQVVPAVLDRINASRFFTQANALTSVTSNEEKVTFQMSITLPTPSALAAAALSGASQNTARPTTNP